MTDGRHESMWRGVCALLLALLAGCGRGAGERPETPGTDTGAARPVASTGLAMTAAPDTGRLRWPVPAGWEHETIPFPFEFAPTIAYHGVEELRFAPGFYAPDQAGYWLYVITWWISDTPDFTAPAMAAALTTYFRGLATTVARGKFDVRPSLFGASLAPGATANELMGTIRSVDGFTTGKPITLNASLTHRTCARAARHAIVMRLSPQPRSAPIWRELESAASALTCE